MLWILIFIFLLWCAVKKTIFSVAFLIAILGCEKASANEDIKAVAFFGDFSVFLDSEIYQDMEQGIYAPPYDFKPVENLQNNCMKNFWTKELIVRITPIIQEEIYSLASEHTDSILSSWRDEIRSPATNQYFSVIARNIASPTTTGRTIYPKLKKELLDSAYFKKSASWFEVRTDDVFNSIELTSHSDLKNMDPEHKKKITDGLPLYFCLVSDLMMGVHGKPSISADLMKKTNREVSAKGIKSSMEQLRNILLDE